MNEEKREHKRDVKVKMRAVGGMIECPDLVTGFSDHLVEWGFVDEKGNEDESWSFAIAFAPVLRDNMPFKSDRIGGFAAAGGEIILKVKQKAPINVQFKYCVFAVNIHTGQCLSVDPRFEIGG